jgi:hypothetical protein
VFLFQYFFLSLRSSFSPSFSQSQTPLTFKLRNPYWPPTTIPPSKGRGPESLLKWFSTYNQNKSVCALKWLDSEKYRKSSFLLLPLFAFFLITRIFPQNTVSRPSKVERPPKARVTLLHTTRGAVVVPPSKTCPSI